jgi:hypothetical protein
MIGDTHASTTEPESRLARNGSSGEALVLGARADGESLRDSSEATA